MQLTARAKINLALHVTGQCVGGYHLLDTLVTFADFGDELQIEPAPGLSLSIDGPEAGQLVANDDNLILQAAKALRSHLGQADLGASIHLTKNLPIASGIGGGSADAAAALRGLTQLWDVQIAVDDLMQIALSLGADVPMCLTGTAARITGIGETIKPLPIKPLNLVLLNPRIPLPTPDVFQQLATKENPTLTELYRCEERSDRFWIDYLLHQRNDLQDPACVLAPQVADCLTALEQFEDCMLARMSGSGATCFGVFENPSEAAHAAHMLRHRHEDWLVMPARTIDGSGTTGDGFT